MRKNGALPRRLPLRFARKPTIFGPLDCGRSVRQTRRSLRFSHPPPRPRRTPLLGQRFENFRTFVTDNVFALGNRSNQSSKNGQPSQIQISATIINANLRMHFLDWLIRRIIANSQRAVRRTRNNSERVFRHRRVSPVIDGQDRNVSPQAIGQSQPIDAKIYHRCSSRVNLLFSEHQAQCTFTAGHIYGWVHSRPATMSA